ncbi:D-alanyl-D-alanine carboxypeptidase/D-alanyl-D-alanine-endopeptidase [Rhodococcus sp. X156]|uniref:D-alanyl-D-alanine carboxypeptidase/D-alanyl-D-alanine endopeptidase n=1 Tax=Rhodococcus sp. X156 TaxID=2499145 RepID=UPI001F49D8C2|nr:D-alanyl-D-alanine carboxypeptidase/D-alanyl-D-alanine-endopeptidase [Rhodococcus sp. X156]
MRRRRALRQAAGLVLVVLVVVIAVLVVVRTSDRDSSTASAAGTSAPPAPVQVSPQIKPASSDAPIPTPAGLAATLAPLVTDPSLGTLTGRVDDAETGAVLWQSSPDVPQLPASTSKVLTVAGALLALGPDHTVQTRVMSSAVPGQVVLVGGGDVTLTAAPVGTQGYYPQAAHLDDLVNQVRAKGIQVSSVVVDTSAYAGPPLATGWIGADVGEGYIAPMEPLMLEGGRLDPSKEESPRSATPALDTARVFAQRLGVPAQAVTAGVAAPGAQELAVVSSAPLRIRIQQLTERSDNVVAEALGREVAAAKGQPQSFVGAASAVATTLSEVGVNTNSLIMQDTSGLSILNRAPARVLADVVRMAAGNGPHADALRPILASLPVAGVSGTLTDRYGGPVAKAGAGWVRAKTGTLTGVNSLAGTVTDVDGRVLTFALIANGAATADTRPALDAIAATLRTCGCR